MTETILLVGGPESGKTMEAEFPLAVLEVTVPVVHDPDLRTWTNEPIIVDHVKAIYHRRGIEDASPTETAGAWPYDYQPTPAQRATMAVEREAEGRMMEARRVLQAATADREEADRKAGM